MDAGNARRNQQLCEAAFASRGTQGHTVEQNLISGCAEENAAAPALIKRSAQLFPRGLKLGGRASVAKLIEPRKLQQNIQAADKCPSRAARFALHTL